MKHLNQDLALRAKAAEEWLNKTEAERIQDAQKAGLNSVHALAKTAEAERVLAKWRDHVADAYISF